MSVGRVARLRVVRHPTRQARRLAAGNGEGVEVAQHVEDDLLPIGRDVERHERRCLNSDIGLRANRAERRTNDGGAAAEATHLATRSSDVRDWRDVDVV